jgi:hypothetical protein
MSSWNPSSTPVPSTTDTSALLQQVAANTSELVRWVKYLLVAVVVLIVVTAVLLV